MANQTNCNMKKYFNFACQIPQLHGAAAFLPGPESVEEPQVKRAELTRGPSLSVPDAVVNLYHQNLYHHAIEFTYIADHCSMLIHCSIHFSDLCYLEVTKAIRAGCYGTSARAPGKDAPP